MKKYVKALLPMLIASFLLTIPAHAHVTVKPDTSATSAWETYTLKVPSESASPTTKVVVTMPTGVEFQQYEPVPGWKTTTEEKDGKVTRVTWEATGDGVLAGQFQQFVFVAKNPDKASEAKWDAYQYYKDGTVVEWTGDQDSDKPHSITNIVASNTVTDSHGQEKPAEEKASETVTKTSSSSPLTLGLAIAGLVVALIALGLAFRKK
ncbi:YcnI family protein [Bacillus sp. 179-C3.3 HS]|uniref:YcnI family copper-binding membrane protein n=1 Tax=Bacillus sp. 179-C3.3 HS TaxID=3232162 RepID=UPI00399F9887